MRGFSKTAYSHGMRNPCDIPIRAVTGMRIANGPRNGLIFVFEIECGHLLAPAQYTLRKATRRPAVPPLLVG